MQNRKSVRVNIPSTKKDICYNYKIPCLVIELVASNETDQRTKLKNLKEVSYSLNTKILCKISSEF